MDQTTLKMATAAFMHDIGKFADKGVLDVTDQYINDNAGLYLPFRDGRHSHYHSVYTAAFIELMQDVLPPEFNTGDWGVGDAFINLAAGHHKPETPMQWAIAVADRVSSGWDRDTFDMPGAHHVSVKDYKKTRLLPVFEQLAAYGEDERNNSEEYCYRYPLKALTPKNVFPVLKQEIEPKDSKNAENEYRELYEVFTSGLKRLKHKNSDISLWFEHFDSLMMACTSAMPAARVGNVVPDVSLYDHSRVTAALATAIYLYHATSDSMREEAIKNYDDRKFLIVNGDLQGIQNFIFGRFGDTARYRSKILRGRSFAVSLLTELAADMLCREIGLPFSSVLLNAAGKFTIIAPNIAETRQSMESVQDKINDWLVKISLGETVISFSAIEAACVDFVSGHFTDLWDNIVQAMVEKKFESINLKQYGGALTDYLERFVSESDHPPLCPVCGRRPAVKKARASVYVKEVQSICSLCRDHVFIGANLVRESRMVVTAADTDIGGKEERLIEPIFDKYQLTFLKEGLEGDPVEELVKQGRIYKYWDLGGDFEKSIHSDVTVKPISGYVPRYGAQDEMDERIFTRLKSDEDKQTLSRQIKSGDPKTLNDIAGMALNPEKSGNGFKGVEALGVLKADVDNLGLLLGCGLKQERFTLSRLATISRQLNNYFTVYLPDFLKTEKDFQDVYTVFAGGDDLFLIGPWNRIIDLAREIQKSFSAYVCHNPQIHLSAGISLHKPHSPIDTMAVAADSALEVSKSKGRNRLTLFSETAEWEAVAELVSVRHTFEDWLDKGWISNVLFYRFNEFIRMAAREKQVLERTEISLNELACTKWRSMLVYATERNVANNIKGDERKKVVGTVTQTITGWLDEYEGKLKIPVWSIMYNRR